MVTFGKGSATRKALHEPYTGNQTGGGVHTVQPIKYTWKNYFPGEVLRNTMSMKLYLTSR